MEEHTTTLRQNLQLLADLWFYSIKIYLLFYKIWILRGKVFKSQLVLIIMCFLGRIDKCLALKKRHKMWAELKKTSFCLLRVSFFCFFHDWCFLLPPVGRCWSCRWFGLLQFFGVFHPMWPGQSQSLHYLRQTKSSQELWVHQWSSVSLTAQTDSKYHLR